MAKTHIYELKIGDSDFEGEIEFTNAGVISFTEDNDDKMGYKVYSIVKTVFDELSKSYADFDDFEKFEISKKE